MIRPAYLYAGSLAAGLAFAVVARFTVAAVALVACACFVLARVDPRLVVALALLVGGWWWGTERLHALDASALAAQVDTAGIADVRVTEPPRTGMFDVRVRGNVVRWRGVPLHERVLVRLPGSDRKSTRLNSSH